MKTALSLRSTAFTARGLLRSRVIGLVIFDLAFIAAVGLYNPDFARVENFTVIADNMATDAIVLTGTVLLLAAGRFDLSIDGVATMCGIIAGKLMVGVGLPWPLAFALALAVGLFVGFINGFLIEVMGLNPLMTTLGTWWVTAGIALGLTQGFDPTGFPQGFNNLGQATVGGFLISVWYALALVVITAVVLSFTRVGAHIFATGGDREAARLNGVKVRRIGVGLYTLSGGLSAFAGIIFAARLSTGTSTAFDGLALSVIAAGVIGGASLAGGRGSVIGGLLGLLLLNMLGNASIYVGISPYWQKGISGVVLLAAVIADVVAERRAKHAGEPRKPWLQQLRQRIQAVNEREALPRKEERVRT